MVNLNTKEYWDNRFCENWLDYEGDKQSIFFASILCDLLPREVKNEIIEKHYTVCDMGCAMGDGTQVFTREFAVKVDGADFSPQAVEKAQKEYPECDFFVCDINNIPSNVKYDVIVCSNVLEHFIRPWDIFKNFAACSSRYIIILVPYREKIQIDEHMYHFKEENIPVCLENFLLCYSRTIDGNDFDKTYYPDQQILLVYKKMDKTFQVLAEITQGTEEAFTREENRKIGKLNEELNNKQEELNYKQEELNYKQEEIDKGICEKEIVLKENERLILENKELEKDKAELIQIYEKEKKDISIQCEAEKNSLINNFEIEKSEMIKRYEIEKSEIIKSYEIEKEKYISSLGEREAQYNYLYNACCDRDKAMAEARDYCYQINGTKAYKLSLLFYRYLRQVVKGDRNSKKDFWKMIRNHKKNNAEWAVTRDDSYNFIVNAAKKLVLPERNMVSTIISEDDKRGIIVPSGLDYFTWNELSRPYKKVDVIFLSVISYDFRFQRPQQFAKRFAENGHRVFYVNADFNRKESVDKIADNLYAVNLFSDSCTAIYYANTQETIDWMYSAVKNVLEKYAVCDAVVIVDYPNWVETAISLKNEFGFRMVTDYMDDYTGFMTTANDSLKERCIKLLGVSDSVVCSSNFLYDIASKYSEHLSIIRNGTETDHFKIKGNVKENERPIIGYYGAISDWFAWEKICCLAKNLPDYDIVLIGEITKNREKFEKFKNIKLLGEMKYADLPKELEKFDVCLIPFDTSTDLIKATNPVKFYEYLSAGKKVVATEIPELLPFKDEYVYMSNDDEKFLEYVKLCIEGKDELKDSESCVRFAEENDWQKRYENFYECLSTIYPRVSIVVLTYNNLGLNKECIQSVLEKTAYPNYELIVLDNCSTDGTREYLKELQDKGIDNLRVILNEQNSGFAGGNNIAIEASEGDYIVLLNNDTIVSRGWLTNFVKHFSNNPKTGMVGAVTNSIGNEAMITVQYTNKKELLSFAYQYMCSHRNQTYTDIDRIAMFGVMIKRDIVNEFGALDASYKVGMFEDDDYAMVVRKAGYELYLAEDVFIHHVNNASFKKLESKEYKEIFETNKKYYEQKWNTTWKMPKYRDGVTWNSNDGMMVEPK